MSFWTDPSLEPKRKFRFRFSTPSSEDITGFWWFAKSVDKPSYVIDSGEYQLINHKFKYPGIATWNDISITVVDPLQSETVTNSLMEELKKRGHTADPTASGKTSGIYKEKSDSGAIDQIVVEQLNAAGEQLEEWTLNGAWIKSVNFGSLSYQDDELVELEIVVSYDYATFKGK